MMKVPRSCFKLCTWFVQLYAADSAYKFNQLSTKLCLFHLSSRIRFVALLAIPLLVSGCTKSYFLVNSDAIWKFSPSTHSIEFVMHLDVTHDGTNNLHADSLSMKHK